MATVSMFTTICVLSLLFGTCITNANSAEDNGWSDTTVTIEWTSNYQTMRGFGTFAGSSNFIYANPNRDHFLDLLFGEKGLKLTVIRSTVPPNFKPSVAPNDDPETWIQHQVKQTHGISMFIASAWSPPYQWKSIKNQSTGAHMNELLAEHYDDYANYMADFVEFRKKIGLELYAVSPQNEPEFATTNWDGCVWLPQQTAKFVRNYLKPTFKNRNITTMVIIGENANWNVANLYLSTASMMLRNEDFDIYGSHGYSLPKYPKFTVTYNQHVFPWLKAFMYKKDRWITEASSTEKFDGSMKMGIQLAVSLSRLLTTGNINGYIFWNGVIDGESNEGLIAAMKSGSYILPRVYHVYGHFSRFIKPGSIRIKATKSLFPLESDLEVVAFKDLTQKSFAVVVTNYANSKSKTCILRFKYTQIDALSITAILTDNNNQWTNFSSFVAVNNTIALNAPPMSVITVNGSILNRHHSNDLIENMI